MSNPFIDRAARTANLTNSHKRAPKMEKAKAERLGGQTIGGSGAGHLKGDVRIKGIARVECKTTKNKSFSVTREMIDKIESATFSTTEVPTLIVEFTDGFGKVEREVAVIPMWALEGLLCR